MKQLLTVQDNSHLGIKATMARLTDALRAADQELWLHIDIKNKVGARSDTSLPNLESQVG